MIHENASGADWFTVIQSQKPYMALWYSGLLCSPVKAETRVQFSLEPPLQINKAITAYQKDTCQTANEGSNPSHCSMQ